jgi:hypothetical protein
MAALSTFTMKAGRALVRFRPEASPNSHVLSVATPGARRHPRVSRDLDQARALSLEAADPGYPQRRAPVAQWIEQRFPKPRALVRFRPGASPMTESKASHLAGAFVRSRPSHLRPLDGAGNRLSEVINSTGAHQTPVRANAVAFRRVATTLSIIAVVAAGQRARDCERASLGDERQPRPRRRVQRVAGWLTPVS